MEKQTFKRQAWTVTLTVLFAGISLAWMQNKVVPLVSVLMERYNASSAAVGWLSSIFSLMAVITAIPSAIILQRLGVRKCGVISLLFAILGAVMGCLVESFALLMVSRIIEGIGIGIISVVAPSVISGWFSDENRGLPMGLWGSWQMIAQSAVFFSAVPVMNWLGWKGMWTVGIVLCGLAAVLYMLLVKEAPAQSTGEEPSQGICWSGLRNPRAWIIGLVGFLFSCCCFGWVTWAGSAWTDNLGISGETSNTYLAYMFVLEIPMVILIGFLFDKLYHKRKLLGGLSCLLYAVMLLWTYSLRSTAVLIPALLLYPFFEGAVATYLWTVMPQTARTPEETGMTLAVLTLCMNLGAVAGPPVVGILFDMTQGYGASGIAMAAAMAASAMLICFAKGSGPNSAA